MTVYQFLGEISSGEPVVIKKGDEKLTLCGQRDYEEFEEDSLSKEEIAYVDSSNGIITIHVY